MIAVLPAAAGGSRGWTAGGHPDTRVSATGCPGIAASSPLALREQDGSLVAAAVADARFARSRGSATGFGKSGARYSPRSECCRAEAVVPPPRGDKGRTGSYEKDPPSNSEWRGDSSSLESVYLAIYRNVGYRCTISGDLGINPLEQGNKEGEIPVFDPEFATYDVHSQSRIAWECCPKWVVNFIQS